MELTSTAFKQGEAIPAKFTCDGQNVSPSLKWHDIPANTKSLVLICDDPDAPGKTFVHWVVYNISPSITEFSENIIPSDLRNKNIMEGKTDFNRIGYSGPCPPGGTHHHYHFKLYAIDREIDKTPGLRKINVLKEMERHILAQCELVGIYKRH